MTQKAGEKTSQAVCLLTEIALGPPPAPGVGGWRGYALRGNALFCRPFGDAFGSPWRQAAMTRQRLHELRAPRLRRRLPRAVPNLRALLLLALLLPAVAGARTPCLKLVFNRYCLGGDVDVLAQQVPPDLRHDQVDRVALIYYEGRERDYVLAWRGLVYKVLRDHRIASQLHYEDLYRLLRDKYGDGEDRSSFPAYAHTPGRKQISIRRGEGRAVHLWRTDAGWHIELSWTRETGLALAYIADDLDAQQTAAMESGY